MSNMLTIHSSADYGIYVYEWVIEVAKRSPNKSNVAIHPTQGPHLIYFKTWGADEGYDLFKKQRPEWKYKRSVFDGVIRSFYWLKKPTRSMCLCQPCTNFALFLQALASLQKSLGIDTEVPLSKYSMIAKLSCTVPEVNPIGQADLIAPNCSLNACEGCKDGGEYLAGIIRVLNEVGEGLEPTAKQWMKVDQNGRPYDTTEKKVKLFSSIESFTSEFLEQCVAYKLHFHRWIFDPDNVMQVICTRSPRLHTVLYFSL